MSADSQPMVPAHWADAPEVAGFVGQTQRAFFKIAAAICALGSLTVLALPPPTTDPRVVATVFAGLALLALLSARLPEHRLKGAMVLFVVVDSTALAGVGLVYRGGAGDAAMGIYGVLLCVVCAAAGRRIGIAVAAYQALLLFGVHLLWWPPGEAANAGVPARLALHLIGAGTGLVAGLMVAHSLSRHIHLAAERERRFRRLLALGADLYWETDAEHRLVHVAQPGPDAPPRDLRAAPGAPVWELPGFDSDPEMRDRLRADTEAREAFRDVPLQWRDPDGTTRHYLVSGAPRSDAEGAFLGYWGVARDISESQLARAALAATEGRYRELFDRSPTPLVVQRAGRVIDANPAALAMFGHETLEDMLGADLLLAFEEGESRERARARLARLQDLPLGASEPVADFRLLVGGRRISVRSTSVNVVAEGGTAMLDLFADDTERLAAELAVRRSEALLSHLVATTPDLVAVSEYASGRFTLVNPAFERMLGWTRTEVLGRTSKELGAWPDPDARVHYLRQLAEQGVVTNAPLRLRTKHGEDLPLLLSAARFVVHQAEFVVVIARDLSESERARLEREAILDTASVGIAVTREGRFVLANRHVEKILGYQPGSLRGEPARNVWADAEEHRRSIAEYDTALRQGRGIEFETTALRRDGTRFLASVRAQAIDPARPTQGGTVWIVEDISERRQAEQALQRARSEAEAASRAKSAFLANTSHELRTPLNAIVGLAALASDPALDGALRQRHLEQIVHSARALAAIISDILDLSKIEAGRLELSPSVFDLGELLRSMQLAYEPQAQARGLRFGLRLGPGVEGQVRGDTLRLRQVVGNFLGNALKFTQQGGIELHASRRAGGERVRIEVQDSGPGIAAEVRTRLFRPFSQADESTTRRFGGTGLGLSISRELATLMDGEVGVDSRPGSGSCFWVELPLPVQAQASAAEPPLELDLRGLRVLMVEDNAVNMLIAAAMLERWGVAVEQAADGAEALQCLQRALAEQRLPDAVLMDVQMPVMSGHEATRRLRELPGLGDLPVVALTAAALVSERDAALACGMNDFLTKPIDPERLRHTLWRWCRGREATLPR